MVREGERERERGGTDKEGRVRSRQCKNMELTEANEKREGAGRVEEPAGKVQLRRKGLRKEPRTWAKSQEADSPRRKEGKNGWYVIDETVVFSGS